MQPKTKQELGVSEPTTRFIMQQIRPETRGRNPWQPAAPRWWNEIMHYAWKTCSASRPDPARTRPHYTSRCDDKLRHSFVLRPCSDPNFIIKSENLKPRGSSPECTRSAQWVINTPCHICCRANVAWFSGCPQPLHHPKTPETPLGNHPQNPPSNPVSISGACSCACHYAKLNGWQC